MDDPANNQQSSFNLFTSSAGSNNPGNFFYFPSDYVTRVTNNPTNIPAGGQVSSASAKTNYSTNEATVVGQGTVVPRDINTQGLGMGYTDFLQYGTAVTQLPLGRNIFDNLGRNKNIILPKGQLTANTDLGEDSYLDEDGRIWQIDRKHAHNIGTKYLSYDDWGGSFEAVIGPDVKYITTGRNGGSYNYFDYRKCRGYYILHVIFDWFPSWLPGGTNY